MLVIARAHLVRQLHCTGNQVRSVDYHTLRTAGAGSNRVCAVLPVALFFGGGLLYRVRDVMLKGICVE